MKKTMHLSTPEEVKIFSHPFRFKIINMFESNTVPLTVKQISDKLGEVPSKVHYHVKQLEKIGVLELVDKKEKAGVIEKYYLLTAETFKIDHAIKIPGDNTHETEENDVLSLVINEVNSNIDVFRKENDPYVDTGRLFSQLIGYLTPGETRELHDMCVEYISKRTKKEGAELYHCTLLTIRKFDEKY